MGQKMNTYHVTTVSNTILGMYILKLNELSCVTHEEWCLTSNIKQGLLVNYHKISCDRKHFPPFYSSHSRELVFEPRII